MMALILVFVWFSQNYYHVCLVTLHAFVELSLQLYVYPFLLKVNFRDSELDLHFSCRELECRK